MKRQVQIEERFLCWRHNGKGGVVQVKLMSRWSRRAGLVRYISFLRWRGDRLPAWLLCPVLDRALGESWRARPHAEGPHPPCGRPEIIHFHRSGRIQVRCGSSRGTLRIAPDGGVSDFELPLKRLAYMVGPGGVASLFPQEQAILEEVDWRWGEEWPHPERGDLVPALGGANPAGWFGQESCHLSPRWVRPSGGLNRHPAHVGAGEEESYVQQKIGPETSNDADD